MNQFIGSVLLGSPLLFSSNALALAVCDADDVCDPMASECVLDQKVDVLRDCTFDFGQRGFTVTDRGEIALIYDGSLTVHAHSITLENRGKITSLGGTGAAALTAHDGVSLQGQVLFKSSDDPSSLLIAAGTEVDIGGTIDLSGSGSTDAGLLDVTAGGDITVDGQILGKAKKNAAGAWVFFDTPGFFSSRQTFDLDSGGIRSARIEVLADAGIALDRGVKASAKSHYGAGGAVLLRSDGDVAVSGRITADAGSRGGLPGVIDLISRAGAVWMDADLSADGESTGIRSIQISAADDVVITGRIDAMGDGHMATGGSVRLFSSSDVTVQAAIDVRGDHGGHLDITGRQVFIDDPLRAEARDPDGYGGDISIEAWDGALTVHRDLSAQPGARSEVPSWIVVDGCEVTIEGRGRVGDSRGNDDHVVIIGVRSTQIEGDVTASTPPELRYRDQAPQITGRVSPAPILDHRPTLQGCR